jgi:hypothetical protein
LQYGREYSEIILKEVSNAVSSDRTLKAGLNWTGKIEKMKNGKVHVHSTPT